MSTSKKIRDLRNVGCLWLPLDFRQPGIGTFFYTHLEKGVHVFFVGELFSTRFGSSTIESNHTIIKAIARQQ